MSPRLLIADEPTASLEDGSGPNYAYGVKVHHDMGVLMISHDLGLVAQNCDYVYIMYLGKIVEEGHPIDLFSSPQHLHTGINFRNTQRKSR